MRAKEFYQRFIAVHKCIGCGEILPWQRSDEAFCEMCQQNWNADTLRGCVDCFLPARECECMPKSLKSAGALTHRKLVFYSDSGDNSTTNGIIYWLKHRKSDRGAHFVARELTYALNTELEALDVTDQNVIITHVPRGKRAKIYHGFDQSEMVCKHFSILTGFSNASLFRSQISRSQQKDLNSKERMRHANATISLRPKSDVKDKYIVLFDDIVTSGASMSVCTRLLMKHGAKGVICLSLASRQRAKQKM